MPQSSKLQDQRVLESAWVRQAKSKQGSTVALTWKLLNSHRTEISANQTREMLKYSSKARTNVEHYSNRLLWDLNSTLDNGKHFLFLRWKKNYWVKSSELWHMVTVTSSTYRLCGLQNTLPLVTCMAATIKGPTAKLTQLLEVFT